MLKIYVSFFIFCLGIFSLQAQVKESLIAPTKVPLEHLEKLVMPQVNNQALMEKEILRRGPGISPQFAKAFEVDITPKTHGHWETLSNGLAVWRLPIQSKTAYSLNLGFSSYYMPKGGKMILYSPDKQEIMGPFTKSDNEDHAQLWTPIFKGDELVIEISLPARLKSFLEIQLISINHDFLNFLEMATSGSCNLDVICGQDDGWGFNDQNRNAIQSVGIYGFGGTNFCTGFLINNTKNDCRPYFLTAFHCGVNSSNAPSVVVYWNFQNRSCRQPRSSASGGPGNGFLNTRNIGAKLVSTYRRSDFTLLELDDEVPEAADAYFAGWSRQDTVPTDTVLCVHHPNSSEKRISYSFRDTYLGDWESEDTPVPGGDHIVVPRWDIGTTEVGSSGGPLFNKDGKVVGQLHGGFADCNNFFYDSFGAFAVSWTGGRSSFSSLAPHLDPKGANLLNLEGRSQRVCSFSLNPEVLVQEICLPDTAKYPFRLSDNFTQPVQLSVQGLSMGLRPVFSKNPVEAGESVSLSITADDTLSSGLYTFTIFGQSGEETVAADFDLIVSNGPPNESILKFPENKLGDIPNVVNFEWESQGSLATFHLQVGLDSLFNEIVGDFPFIDTTFFQFEVVPEQQYFWRVRAENTCGNGEWSKVRTFRTADVACNLRIAENLPIVINENESSITQSIINFSNPGKVIKVSVIDLDIEHTFVGDIKASLTSPSGKVLRLFDRIGSPDIIFGCAGDNMKVSFFDDASRTAGQLENTCGSNPAAIGNFQPIDPFSNLVGEPAEGDWILTIEDFSNQDGGQLNGWKLDICATQSKGITLTPSTPELEVCVNQKGSFNMIIGPGFDSAGTMLSYRGLPEEASVVFSDNPALPGSTVSVSIEGLINPGEYPLEIMAIDSVFKYSSQILISVVTHPSLPSIIQPEYNAQLVSPTPTFSWAESEEASSYKLEISTNEQFSDTILLEHLETNTYSLSMPLNPGLYYWRVTASNACGASTTATSIFDVSTTNIETVSSSSLKIYPNPANNQLTLDFGQYLPEGFQWHIRSLNGQVIVKGEASSSSIHSINVREVPKGLYLLEVRSPSFSIVKKIVKN